MGFERQETTRTEYAFSCDWQPCHARTTTQELFAASSEGWQVVPLYPECDPARDPARTQPSDVFMVLCPPHAEHSVLIKAVALVLSLRERRL